MLGDLPPVLIRFFAPAPVPRLLGLEATGGMDRMLETGLRIGSTLGVGMNDEERRKLVHRLSRDLMIGIINAQRGDQRPFFRIPSALAGVWKLG